MDECGNKPQPLKYSWDESTIFDKKGNLYLFQIVCCKEEGKCINKIRIIKIARGK
jgi:hypothetical protein